MRAAPGGQLPPEQIVGRGAFIRNLWEVLENSSVRMEAERRIGKTSILDKMRAEPPAGWEPLLLDLEQVHSATEFAEKVTQGVQERLIGWKKHGSRLRGLLELLGGSTLGPIKFPDRAKQPDDYWKQLLTAAVEDLVEQQQAAGKRVVFLFDELPWMLTSIVERDGEKTAMEVLDVLRSLRQSPATKAGFRMVLCGSIGLHHILERLRRGGYQNRPVNDLILVEVKPLAMPVAVDLARALVRGESLDAAEGAAEAIAEQANGFPYYVHWVVYRLKSEGPAATIPAVDGAVKWLLTAPHDPCDFRHFRDRLHYYGADERVALALLDHAAATSGALSRAELINVAKTAGATDDERVHELIRLLAADHYLDVDTEGRIFFRHALLRRWWVSHRGLEVRVSEGE